MMKVLLTLFSLTLFAAGFLSCSQTRFIPVETTRRDSVFQDRFFRDSIIIRDSVVLRQAGDTVYLDRIRYRYQDRIVRDTVFRYNDRTTEVRVEVEKPQSASDIFFAKLGKLSLVFLLIVFTFFLRKIA